MNLLHVVPGFAILTVLMQNVNMYSFYQNFTNPSDLKNDSNPVLAIVVFEKQSGGVNFTCNAALLSAKLAITTSYVCMKQALLKKMYVCLGKLGTAACIEKMENYTSSDDIQAVDEIEEMHLMKNCPFFGVIILKLKGNLNAKHLPTLVSEHYSLEEYARNKLVCYKMAPSPSPNQMYSKRVIFSEEDEACFPTPDSRCYCKDALIYSGYYYFKTDVCNAVPGQVLLCGKVLHGLYVFTADCSFTRFARNYYVNLYPLRQAILNYMHDQTPNNNKPEE